MRWFFYFYLLQIKSLKYFLLFITFVLLNGLMCAQTKKVPTTKDKKSELKNTKLDLNKNKLDNKKTLRIKVGIADKPKLPKGKSNEEPIKKNEKNSAVKAKLPNNVKPIKEDSKKQERIKKVEKNVIREKSTITKLVIHKANLNSKTDSLKRIAWLEKVKLRDSIANAKKQNIPEKAKIVETPSLSKLIIDSIKLQKFNEKRTTDSIVKVAKLLKIKFEDSIKVARVVKNGTSSNSKADSLKRVAWLQKVKLIDSIASAKKQNIIAKVNTIETPRLSKLITDSIKLQKINEKRTADSIVKVAKLLKLKFEDSIKVARVVKNSTYSNSNIDSLKRIAWLQKVKLRDSIASAKKQNAIVKVKIVEKPNGSMLIVDSIKLQKMNEKRTADSIIKVTKLLKIKFEDSTKAANIKEKMAIKKALEEKKKQLVNLDSIITFDSNAVSKNVGNYVGNYASDNIIDYYSNQQYTKVAKLGDAYLKKNPNDADIAIKTGLSYLFIKKFKQGFNFIDKTIINKDSLIQFYSVLPFVNYDAKDPDVYTEIVKHVQSIDASNIWSLFSIASYYYQIDSLNKAFDYGKAINARISNKNEASSLGHLYPNILFAQENTSEAILILEQLTAQYAGLSNLEHNLFVMYRKTNQHEKAYKLCNTLLNYNDELDDYTQAKIDLCLLLGKKEEACALLKQENTDLNFDEKIIQAGCESEFTSFNLKMGSKLKYKVNHNGSLSEVEILLNNITQDSLFFVYSSNTRFPLNGSINLSNNALDSVNSIYTNWLWDRKTNFTNALPILISKQNFKQILLQKETYLDIGKGLQLFSLIAMVEDVNVFADRVLINSVDKKLLHTLHLVNAETNEQIWILDNVNCPLIIKMEADAGVELFSIN
jgi:tetratricopeptide (TPR) repeat protein